MKLILGIIAIVLVFVGGFYFFHSYIYSEGPVEEVGRNPQQVAPIDGGGEFTLGIHTWTWVETLYNDERMITPQQERAFTLTFSNDGRFSATTDCNQMAGSYATDETALTFSDIIATKKFCQDSQEQEFATMLSNTSHYHFSERGELILDLKFDSGTVTLR